MLDCPLFNPIKDKFQSLFAKAVLGSFESIFQLDHQVDISLYLTEATALHHSKKISQFSTTLMYHQSYKLFSLLNFKIDFN